MSSAPLRHIARVMDLDAAALCVACHAITDRLDECPRCNSRALMHLSGPLNRTSFPGVATMLADAGVPSAICTYTGRLVEPLNANPADIAIEDIAHALSNQCRFSGHTKRFYSVAEHSIYVSRLVPQEFRLAGLLHDAAEAYLVDLPSPLKVLPEFAAYRQAEEHLMAVIGERFGFSQWQSFEVHEADQRMLAHEMRELMTKDARTPEVERYVGRFQCRFASVETTFLNEFDALVGVRRGRASA